MVYSFCVNPNDMKEEFAKPTQTAGRFAGLASEQFISKDININHKRNKAIVNVDENYGTVAEWKEYAQSDAMLTEHYREKYREFMQEAG